MTEEKADPAEPTYEEALGKLEEIVSAMESGELKLEQLINHYEEGMRYRRICQDKLRAAEKRIQVLEESREAEPSLAG